MVSLIVPFPNRTVQSRFHRIAREMLTLGGSGLENLGLRLRGAGVHLPYRLDQRGELSGGRIRRRGSKLRQAREHHFEPLLCDRRSLIHLSAHCLAKLGDFGEEQQISSNFQFQQPSSPLPLRLQTDHRTPPRHLTIIPDTYTPRTIVTTKDYSSCSAGESPTGGGAAVQHISYHTMPRRAVRLTWRRRYWMRSSLSKVQIALASFFSNRNRNIK